MPDIFDTGTFYHPQDLWGKVDQLIQDAGWSVRSTVYDGYDRVYFSDGYDGKSHNYLRVAHRKQDDYRANRGFTQWLDADGYSDYVNFFAYQFFPQDGADGSGYGEIGVFGPRLYACRGSGQSDIRWSNMMTGTAGTPRWTDMKANLPNPFGSDRQDSGESCDTAFDGHRFLYYSYGNDMYRYDVSTGTGAWVGFTPASSSLEMSPVVTSYVREVDRHVLLMGTNSTSSGFRVVLMAFDRSGTKVEDRGVENPPWGGTRFDEGAGAAFGRYFYMFRGDVSDDVAIYDYLTDSWLDVADTPLTGFEGGSNALIVTKESSGLPNHRLYANRGGNTKNTNFWYMNLDDDGLPLGGLPGTWNNAASLPIAVGQGGATLDWDGNRRIWFNPGDDGSTQREMYYYDVINNNWTLFGTNYFFSTMFDGSSWDIHYSLQSRVRAWVGEEQKYWFFGNKDRIVVVTKSATNQYAYCYGGTIDSFFDDSLQTRTTAAISSGVNVSVPVESTAGFSVGQKIMIADVDGYTNFSVTGMDARVKNFTQCEHVQIVSISGSSLIVGTLNGSYPTGALVGVDVQNMVLSVEGTRYVQALNIPQTSNSYASGDIPECVYIVEPAIASEYSGKTDLNARTDQFTVWPLLVFTEGSINRYSGKEVRGQLINTYVVGTGSGESEDLVKIGNDSYMIFKIARQEDNRFVAFGPIV